MASVVKFMLSGSHDGFVREYRYVCGVGVQDFWVVPDTRKKCSGYEGAIMSLYANAGLLTGQEAK